MMDDWTEWSNIGFVRNISRMDDEMEMDVKIREKKSKNWINNCDGDDESSIMYRHSINFIGVNSNSNNNKNNS